jgi:hypothetical protein
MEKTPDYEGQKRDPRNPPMAEEASTEQKAKEADPEQTEGATPT